MRRFLNLLILIPFICFGANESITGALVVPGSTSGKVTLTAPATVTDYSVIFPNAAPSANDTLSVMDTDGSLEHTVVTIDNVGSIYADVNTAWFLQTKDTASDSYGVQLQTGNSSAGASGFLTVKSGTTNAASKDSGGVAIASGNATGTTSSSGGVIISTGTGTTSSGDVELRPGTGGEILLDDGSGTIADGQVWTATAVTGEGNWETPTTGTIDGSLGVLDGIVPRADSTGGSTLQNSLVKIDDNGHILPATGGDQDLGTSALPFRNIDGSYFRNNAAVNPTFTTPATTGSAPTLFFRGGTSSGTGSSSVVYFASGDKTSGTTGNSGGVIIESGEVRSGNSVSGNSGTVTVRTGPALAPAGNSGTILIESGNSTNGSSGGVILRPNATFGTTRGVIQFVDGSEGTTGHVWTSTDSVGSGSWSAPQVVNPETGGVRMVSAFITNSGTPTVSREDGNWIDTITDSGTGDMTLNLVGGTFASTPNCTASISDTNPHGLRIIADSSTAIRIDTFETTGNTATDVDITVICIGPQ